MARQARFLDALRDHVIVGDGAMGTALHRRGIGPDACLEELNVERRELVRDVHREYVLAGSELIETNTFRANREYLSQFGLGDQVFQLNYQGARIARSVAGRSVFVGGSVGPLPHTGPSRRHLGAEAVRELYTEQMAALAAGGVDCFVLETFTDLTLLRTAVTAAREAAPGIPVVAQMAFYEGRGSLHGVTIGRAVEELVAAGADCIGVNCGRGFADAVAVTRAMVELTDVPICAFPNAGLPEVTQGRLVYHQPPEYMAELAEVMADLGVNMIGGCCGTDSDSIAAIAARIGRRAPATRPTPRVVVSEPEIDESPSQAALPEGSFLRRTDSSPYIVVELDPPRGMETEAVIEGCRKLRDVGVDLVSMAENPLASIRMGNVGMAYLVRRETGIEPLVHFTGRDRNAIGLHSDLMGAGALGIRHVLAITGDPAGPRDTGVTSVFDVNSIGLVRILSALNAGHTMHGVGIGTPTEFTVGVAFNPNFRSMAGQIKKLHQKVEAGADFALSQLVYDPVRMQEVEEAVAPCGIPVLPGVMPFVSLRNARFMKNEVPGLRVPDELIRRMEAHPTGPDAAKVGLDIAREMLVAAHAGGSPGAYIVTPFNRVDLSLELVAFVRELWG